MRPALLERRLVPERCFHTKTFIFQASENVTRGALGVFIGSANLTLSGLHTGAEHGIALLFVPPLGRDQQTTFRQVRESLAWWDSAWDQAAAATESFVRKYTNIRPKIPREDTAGTVTRFAAPGVLLEPFEGLRWSHAKCLWVQTHELYKNRGEGKPGNQLDLRRGTRVYFGFSPAPVSPNTILGNVTMRYADKQPNARSVRFGDNHMDKVNLPIPGEDGPASYDNTYVHFERIGKRSFKVTLSTDNEQQIWRKTSVKQQMLYALAGGREYGFYS